jgi:transposase
LTEELDNSALEKRLYRGEEGVNALDPHPPDWDWVRRELRKKHVTLMLLWQEYKAAHPEGYQYSWFCRHYALFAQKLDVVMRQDHKLGEKGYVDYAGDTLEVVDPESGEVQKAYLFVGVLGASNYTYVEACLAQDLMSWILAHVRMFDFWGGCPEILVPDNLKCGVLSPNRYEPDLNPAYQEMAEHYGVAVIPARVRRPKDKAKVENGVLIAERWILSTVVTSQFPVDKWHGTVGDPTVADALLDRLVHTATKIHLKGPSMRGEKTTKNGKGKNIRIDSMPITEP